MKQVENMLDLYAWRDSVNDYANDDGATLWYMQQQLLNQGDARDAALSAWLDLMPEHQGNALIFDRVFSGLFQKGVPIRDTPKPDASDRLDDISDSLRHSFPSQFQDRTRRKSFAHLLTKLEQSGVFGKNADYEDIANTLFKPYMVLDGGAGTSMVFKRSELEQRGIKKSDLEDSVNYAVLRALKEGKNLQFEYLGDNQIKSKEGMEKIMKHIQSLDSGASMWTGVRKKADGNGMEVVIVAGNRADIDSRTVVGRWVYEDIDEDGNKIMSRLEYDDEETIRVLSAYKRGNFMDIDNNDNNIYFRVRNWIDRGPSNKFKSIPGGLEEVLTQPFIDLAKFEYDEVVLPFWEKYGPKGGDLSPEEFAQKWEEVRRKETYAFEEKYFDLFTYGLVDPYHPMIAPGAAYGLSARLRQNMERKKFKERYGTQRLRSLSP